MEEQQESEISEELDAETLPGDWAVLSTGEDAATAITEYLLIVPWEQDRAEPRNPTEAVEIKEREEGKRNGKESSIFSWNSKTSNLSLVDSLASFLEDQLQYNPMPTLLIWGVARNTRPELRSFDSRKTFTLVNQAWRAANPTSTPSTSGVNVMALPPGLRGPSPLGMPSPVGAGIHGDIGGTGLAILVAQTVQTVQGMQSVVERQLTFFTDLVARLVQHQVAGAMSQQGVSLELAKMQLEAEMQRERLHMEAENEKRQQTGSMVSNLGGQVLQNPAATAILMGIAGKMGVTQENVMQILKGGSDD